MNNKQVTVYSTPRCPYCVMAKDYLKSKGVEFKDVDVSASLDGAREMVEKSGQMGVPVIDVSGEIMVGFNADALGQLLATK